MRRLDLVCCATVIYGLLSSRTHDWVDSFHFRPRAEASRKTIKTGVIIGIGTFPLVGFRQYLDTAGRLT